MSFAIRSSGPELCLLIQASSSSSDIEFPRPFTMDRRSGRRSGPHRKGAVAAHCAERKPQGAGHRGPAAAPPAPPLPGYSYFTAELAMAFLLVAASLALLPLVLPPLSPPPFLLLLVPVGLFAVLAALAFVPLDAQSHLVGSLR